MEYKLSTRVFATNAGQLKKVVLTNICLLGVGRMSIIMKNQLYA